MAIKTPTVAALFESSVPLTVNYKGVDIALEARPSGFTGKLIAQINEIQTIKDDELYARSLDNIANIVDGLIVRWDLKQSGSDTMPLVFAPGTKQRAQIVGLYPESVAAHKKALADYERDLAEYKKALLDPLGTEADRAALAKPEHPGELAAYDDADLVEMGDVDIKEWLAIPREGPGLLYVMDDPGESSRLKSVRKDSYLPVSDVAALKLVPLVKNYDSVRSLPLQFMQYLMSAIMEAGSPK